MSNENVSIVLSHESTDVTLVSCESTDTLETTDNHILDMVADINSGLTNWLVIFPEDS